MSGPFLASAPGKVLLLGEHAVVYGEPALAAALPRRLQVKLWPDEGGPLIDIEGGTVPPPELTQAFEGLCAAAGAPHARYRVRISSEIPLGGGLGSSAALGVALARAVCAATNQECPPQRAAELALALERVFHGAASGVDPAICARGGILLFQRGDLAPTKSSAGEPVIEPVFASGPFGLVVAQTGRQRGTRSTVLPLRERRAERPHLYDPLIRQLGDLATGGKLALEKGDLVELGVRFDAAHGLLGALGVSCPELDQCVASLRAAGALGAKLTGAGGGGAAIGLARDGEHAAQIAQRLQSLGASAFAVTLGGEPGGQKGASERASEAAPRKASTRTPGRRRATAIAHANIALTKYWGKRDEALLLPEASSLSLALDKLRTRTTVELGAPEDSLLLDGKPASAKEVSRARSLLDAAGIHEKAAIESHNEFPTAAGLASSASGFAALAVAACAAAGLKKSTAELSALARLGSGSAARSVPGGWSVWRDETAEQVFPPSHWDVRMVVALCAAGPKEVGSRDGMKLSKETSPYHAAWIAQCERDLPEALKHLAARDLDALGALAERNALRMHADALAAAPPLLYWQPATIGCLKQLARLREGRVRAWATIDAGPHVVALCTPDDAIAVADALRVVPGVQAILSCAPAGAAHVVEPDPE
ncbi:MAG: diphosphomevalonate decarboxylase [Deltaproteobacteria bacterium]|nr:diphosphomevalonate decarboxylase [Deltaproteobacteria bacterium]